MIRISGPDAIKTAARIFHSSRGRLEDLGPYHALYGKIMDGGLLLDEAVALVFRAPGSFTGEDVVELSVHGGIYLANRVLRAVLDAGARPAGAGEFTRRAFENGKMDLSKAESVMQLIGAGGEQALRAAAALMDGALARRIGEIRERLVSACAAVSAYIDFPEDDLPELSDIAIRGRIQEISDALSRLLSEYSAGKLLTQGVRTVIAGRPNVGKSALMNLLSGMDRSIVTEHAGTTRDVIREQVELDGLPLLLSDTAGIRETKDAVEAIGVERTRRELEAAQLILAVFDGSEDLRPEDEELLGACEGRVAVAIINKTDLPQKLEETKLSCRFPLVHMSAKTGEGTEDLAKTIRRVLELEHVDPAAGILANERQYSCVRRADAAVKEALSALFTGFTPDVAGILLEDALAALLELTGERVSEAVVEEIFKNFCVGK